jgi:hypothetical protein
MRTRFRSVHPLAAVLGAAAVAMALLALVAGQLDVLQGGGAAVDAKAAAQQRLVSTARR